MPAPHKLLGPRRGRPSAARAEAIDRQLVEAGRRLFLSDGYDMVTMEQVAAAAGVSKGTLYARHSSKQCLFEAVVDASVADWSEESDAGGPLPTGNIEQRLRYRARMIAVALRRPDVLSFQRLVLAVRDRFPEVAQAMHDRGYRYIVEIIAADIAEAALRDGIAAKDPVAIAEMLVASMTGRQIQEAPAGAGDTLEAFADRLVDILMAGRSRW